MVPLTLAIVENSEVEDRNCIVKTENRDDSEILVILDIYWEKESVRV